MAGGSSFVWVPFLLICVLPASDNRHVPHNVGEFVKNTGNPQLDEILSRIPIPLPDGTDFDNVNVTSIKVKLCTGFEENLDSLNKQLREASRRNSQLDEEAFALRREVRQLTLKLSTCSLAVTSIAGSYHTQLHNKLKHLLEAIDSENIQVLKIMALTRDVRSLRRKFEFAVNSNGNSTEITAVQAELSAKTAELNAKKQQISRNNETLALILEIISLQNQIWDLQQTELSSKTALTVDRRLLALQELLDRKLSELQRKEDPISIVLELISVRHKITTMEKRIKILTQGSKSKSLDAQRELRQKTEQLKRAILLLSERENDKNLTREILRLQFEVDRLATIVSNFEETLEPTITAITEEMEVKKRKEVILQKSLENTDHAIAQLIMKVISIMEELTEHKETTTGEQPDILTLLQTYKRDYTKALSEIKSLKEQLRQTREQCLGLEERYIAAKTELEQRVAQLNRTEDSKTAFVVSVIHLHSEIAALKKAIVTSAGTKEIIRLQRELLQKEEELKAKTADIERLIPNSQIVLNIIELQNNIWTLQSKDTNETTSEVSELQRRLDGLLSEIDSKDQETLKHMMTVLTLQSQVEYLQKQLSVTEVLQSHRITQLNKELEIKQAQLQKAYLEMKEKNKENGELLVNISVLQSQLRKLEKESEEEKVVATVSKLNEQLKIKQKENQEQQNLIKTLQISLNQTQSECSATTNEQQVQDLQKSLGAKIEELKSKSDTVTSLALQVSTLTVQLEELKKQLESSASQTKVEELQIIIDQKSAELVKVTEELKQRSTQSQRLLQVIAVQVEIDRLVTVASNESDYAKIQGLQDHLSYLIEGIQDTDNENTKLTFKILTQKDEIARLKKEMESQLGAQAEKIKGLENLLESVRNEIKKKTNMLETSPLRIANLSAQIMELNEKIAPLQQEISDLNQTYAENLAELQERRNFAQKKLQNTEAQLKEADARNFKLVMDIANLKSELKKAKEETSITSKKKVTALEQQLRTQDKENRKLESANRDLKQQMEELETCCDSNTHCEDVQRQLQQSQEDADRLHQQLQEKDAALRKLQRDFEQQQREKEQLQENYNNVVAKLTNVEDRTIYNTKVTWDPNTAHPRLVFFSDNTEVSTTDDALQSQDNPSRFDVVLGVLGSTGFSRGRHYWEVSVAEKRCYHIGMVSESAKRRGSLSFRPANGFWTIILNKQGELKAIDRTSVTLQVERLPITLGILLDYKKGQVSFYDAGARSHLYSFSGQEFTDRIYPFLNYCVEDVENPQPIVLLPPGSTDWIN
ncbi:CAP-Gly domain-containing linker protein 1 [Xiphophorus couchianus]|uniref:CAP-Gly domain-containing linker protein 1 n=1 Tax=Xiphophorus couchianus TaxID=32473 RepID=UPI00101699B7|nr:CAP-Gly domain-containing linker protein 1-like [Xiphophorus couchianus]